MPAIQGPNLGLNYGWPLGESGWNTGMDANLKKLDALIQLTVLSATVDVPASPTSGDRYIVPVGATGAWGGQDGKIARYNVDTWEFFTASAGWVAQVLDTGHRLRFSGSAWVAPEEVVVLETGSLIKDYAEATGTASATLDRSVGAWQILNLATATTLDVSGLAVGQCVTITVMGGNTYGLGYAGVGRWSGNGQPQELKAKHDLQFSHNGVETVAFDLGGTD